MLVKTLTKERSEQQLAGLPVAEENSTDYFMENDKQPGPYADCFFIIEDKRLIKIRYADITCIGANRCYINIHTASKRHIVIGSMIQLEKLLPGNIFCRIHRSWIVPVDGISEIGKQRIKVHNEWYPLGITFRRRLLKQLKPYVFNRSYLNEV